MNMVVTLLFLIVLILLFGAGAMQNALFTILLFIAVTTFTVVLWLWANSLNLLDWIYISGSVALSIGAGALYFARVGHVDRAAAKRATAVDETFWAEHHWIRIVADRMFLTELEGVQADTAYAANDTKSLSQIMQLAVDRRQKCTSDASLGEAWRAFALAIPFVDQETRRRAELAFARQQTEALWGVVRAARSGRLGLPQ